MKKHFSIIILIVFLLIFTNCITSHYSPRVTEPNSVSMGFGISAKANEYATKIYILDPMASFFFRYGLPKGIDIGINCNAKYLPLGMGVSIRKQFDFKTPIIDGFNIDMGFGLGFSMSQSYVRINFLKNKFAFSTMYGKTILFAPVIMTPSPFSMSMNNFICKFSYEIKTSSFKLLPYIFIDFKEYYNINQDIITIPLITPLLTDYYEKDDGISPTIFGVGISVYWDLTLLRKGE